MMTSSYHTPLAAGQEIASTIFEGAFGGLDAALTGITEGQPLLKLLNLASSTLTISSGAVTVTQSAHLIDTEGAASTDDLDTIDGGVDGDLLILRPANPARKVVLRSGMGNLAMQSLVTTLSGSQQITLVRQGGNWKDVLNNNVAGIEVPLVPKTELVADTASPLFDIRALPAGFTFLRLLVGQRAASGSGGIGLYANGDAGNSYQRTRVTLGDLGSPSYVNPTTVIALAAEAATEPAGYFGLTVMDIHNYDQPAKYKNFISLQTATVTGGSLNVTMNITTWKNNTAALNRLYGHAAGVTLKAGSWYALFGML